MEAIEKAIILIEEVERLQSKGIIDLIGIGDDEDEFSHQGLCDLSYDLHQLLQSELDCQENKALTIEELKEMVGEWIWIKSDKELTCERLNYASSTVNLYNVIFDDIHNSENKYSYTYNAYKFYKHKPSE